ncbi:MAG: sigma-54-dependent Fis family transcriptional regulator [Planctomycetota bacterium]|nr:MAG: sigma-54-dependent Fis family transcriptional regulator [Planctomycetota bacterium]REK27184.1 MAG: sigma-54-dependent Fis family transcriptional regulator [Planctomycetota bacterium]REK36795.1 MAG: sigma-54-dependent Fis family transcriptional regulator [Planctomycetota bacterium]
MPAGRPIDLLIVEDDDEFRTMAAQWMGRQGHRVDQAPNAQEALRLCDLKHYAVAICDMNLPGISGLEFLQRIRGDSIDTEVIILTGQATVQNAVEAMKLGASDYLTKPFPLSELEQRCRMAAERGRMKQENLQLKTLLERDRPVPKLIGESRAMRDVWRLVERVGPTDKAVLIQGDSGTGKELVARAIQRHSLRLDKPFVTVNCAALPEQLVESELFGHEKGSFTGATGTKPGLFEVADGGTLFIDEIGELAPGLQPKLLRVLEDGSLRRVGSHQERRVDVRLIAATNRDLQQEVENGCFREDLYYRINVMSLYLPPLTERREDVSPLIDHFLPEGWQIEQDARDAMLSYHWPGNVRQLINTIERANILADDQTITIDDLPREVAAAADSPHHAVDASAVHIATGSRKLDDLQRAHILSVLEEEQGNKARTARALGIHRRKLYRLLDRYEIDLKRG